jgi:hypothetical protein
MSTEAMKLALEALYYLPALSPAQNELQDDAIAALEEALTPEQEKDKAVAVQKMKEWAEYLKRKSDYGQHMKIPAEMSAGTCWELATELEQFIKLTEQL